MVQYQNEEIVNARFAAGLVAGAPWRGLGLASRDLSHRWPESSMPLSVERHRYRRMPKVIDECPSRSWMIFGGRLMARPMPNGGTAAGLSLLNLLRAFLRFEDCLIDT